MYLIRAVFIYSTFLNICNISRLHPQEVLIRFRWKYFRTATQSTEILREHAAISLLLVVEGANLTLDFA